MLAFQYQCYTHVDPFYLDYCQSQTSPPLYFCRGFGFFLSQIDAFTFYPIKFHLSWLRQFDLISSLLRISSTL